MTGAGCTGTPPRLTGASPNFSDGIVFFAEFAKQRLGIQESGQLRCPCARCKNKYFFNCDTVIYHIAREGFVARYHTWHFHSEEGTEQQPNASIETRHGPKMSRLLNDALMRDIEVEVENTEGECEDSEIRKFEQLMDEAMRPLYGGCEKYSKLSFMVYLFLIKCFNKWSNKSFSDVVALFKDVLPPDNNVPKNWYESKILIADLGLDCKKIHTCPNDCILYRNKNRDLDSCPMCKTSRRTEEKRSWKKKHLIPAKDVRHFSLVPRLQRLFMSETWIGKRWF